MNSSSDGHLKLKGKWRHSFEEDEPGVEVYRPADTFAFPPARGRDALEFGEGGALIGQTPGADDRPRESMGQWKALGSNRFELSGMQGTSGRVIEVIEHTPEVLKIRKR